MKNATLIATVMFIGCGDTVVAAQGVDEPCGPTLGEGGTADEKGGTAVSGEPNRPGQREAFPFTICGDRFCRDGSPAFLNILGYAPLEPCQDYDGPISQDRIQDDLRRLDAYRGGSDPVLLRVYPQPTDKTPIRMPKSFYDGVRDLGFWVVRDIYLPENCDPVDGRESIDLVIAELEATQGLDVVFAWEFGNEFDCPACPDLAGFINGMCLYLKEQMAKAGRENFSNWVTWASWHKCDPLYTDPNGFPVTDISCLDYRSYDAYPYDPEHIRDHQGGHGTGTPFAGYLAALKQYLPNKPLVVSETGLSDCPTPGGWDHPRLKPWYPAYRFGGLTGDQVGEGLADLYWAARLTGIAGLCFFEWNDEWWKCKDQNQQPCEPNDPCKHALGFPKAPEEYFGLLSFDKYEQNVAETARFKLQQETVRSLFTMCLPVDPPSITLVPGDTSVAKEGRTTIRANVDGATCPPVRFRWETTRGRIVGDSDAVTFYAGGRALGPATVTVTVIDGQGRANTASATIDVKTSDLPWIECLTLGPGPVTQARASGRVGDVDLSTYKVVVYMFTNAFYVQPFCVMKSIWVRPDGYWWTQISNQFAGELHAWLVPVSFDAPCQTPFGWSPPGAIATCVLDDGNDSDSDLLPDTWEDDKFEHRNYDRYDDRDDDLADNLEEFLGATDPTVRDNDCDVDGLPDTWESLYFGTLDFDADDDPDADGLKNEVELALSIHPGRTAVDRDQDRLPDAWEMRWCRTLAVDADELCDGGETNRDAYDLGGAPCFKGAWCDRGPFIVHGFGGPGETSPCTGYVDPRIENLNLNDLTPKLGVQQVVIVFSEPVYSPADDTVTGTDFIVTETGGRPPPTIIGVSTADNIEFKIDLDRPITLEEWTTIQAVVVDVCGHWIAGGGKWGNWGPGNPEPDRVDYGFLPGDITQNGQTTPEDLIRFRQFIATGVNLNDCAAILYYDIDRDGVFPLPADLIKLRQILGGAPPATKIWGGESMNSPQP